jgi:hypothetical protein
VARDEDFDGKKDVGRVVLMRDTVQGLTATGAQAFSQATAGAPGAADQPLLRQ